MSDRIGEQLTFEAGKHKKNRPSIDPFNLDALSIQREKNEAVIALLREWMADESGGQEREWPIIKKALEEDRSSYRRLFND